MTAMTSTATIQNVIEATVAHRDLDRFTQAVWELLHSQMPDADEFGIARHRPELQQFEVVAACRNGTANAANVGVRTGDGEETPGGFLMKMGRTMMINDLDAFETQSGHAMRQLFEEEFASGIGALLEREGRVIGYIYVTSSRKNVFTAEHREFMDEIRGVLALALDNALAFGELDSLREKAELESDYLREEVDSNWPRDGIIGKSPAWKNILSHISHVAPTESTVLIHGETGTGKEVIARAIHERSRRRNKPLIKINCGALPENLVESELFGHEKGSFTGALGKRIGRFELAHGGTIFLDEIGEMPLALQVKLLRVLQEREFERVGGEKPIRVNVRVIAATNKDLQKEMDEGRFRSDLFYRLNVFPITVPPLRERPEDAIELCRYFTQTIAQRMGRGAVKPADDCLSAVGGYSWPGNVRELEHIVERALILSAGREIDLRPFLASPASSTSITLPEPATMVKQLEAGEPISLKKSFEEAERAAIEAALRDSNGVVGGRNGAAARLGLKRQTLQSKMKKLGISLGQAERRVAVSK